MTILVQQQLREATERLIAEGENCWPATVERFTALATPAAVLAMLDEIDRLTRAAKYCEDIDATHENHRETMLYDLALERDELKAENTELRKAAASAFEAGKAASRRPIAIIQRSGNSWNVFEQRYNDDRTERNDRFIRGGFVTSVDATSWARSNGYEVEI